MDVIKLTAGYSSRANTDKTTLMNNDNTVLSLTIETYYPFYENLIVGGHYYNAIKERVNPYPTVILLRNNQYDQGMFTSIYAGVREIYCNFFVTPSDTT